MSPSGIAVVGAVVAGQVLFGLLAAGALFAARRRTSRRVIVQVALIIVFVESFILAVGASALVSARGGSEAVSAALLWYAGIGWLIVQVGILAWWFFAWRQSRSRASS